MPATPAWPPASTPRLYVDLPLQPDATPVIDGPAAHYLLKARTAKGRLIDSVARFHLGNGARLERINWLGDTSPKGLRESAGIMVNYLYRLEDIEKNLADTYYGNVSVFQSMPDHWAVKQLFPVMPIHRLEEEPTRRGVFVDLTCDSDGKIDRFIDQRDVKDVLELHPYNGAPYYIAVFMVGAYQEILGDLHNLFGDTDAVHVKLVGEDYRVEHVVQGDSIAEVLTYVQYQRDDLIARVRRAIEDAVREKRLTPAESGRLMRRYQEGLDGPTYLTHE